MRDTWKSFWYKQYANILPLLAVVFCFILRLFDKTDIFYLKNIDQALTAVITAEAIIISLFSVMLTMLADSKHDSPVIQFFFQHADSEYFVKTLIRCVMVGMLSILLSVGMFFIRPHRAFLIFAMWVGVFVALLCRAYRLISLFISMLFRDNRQDQRDESFRKNEEKLRESLHNSDNR